MFCKIFGPPEDQILVLSKPDEEDKAEVKVFCQPPGGGVCSVAMTFTADEAGDAKAQRALELITEEQARGMVKNVYAIFSESSEDGGAETPAK
jgi:hypothetical protein